MKKKEPKTLGERIRFLRGDMTQSEFADILRIKQAMISRYEANKETPSPKVLLRIGQFSNRTLEWLLTGQDSLGKSRAKRVAAKTTRHMSRDDLIDVASGYVRDTRLPEADEFAEMMKMSFKDRKRLKMIIEYHRFLKFEEHGGRSRK